VLCLFGCVVFLLVQISGEIMKIHHTKHHQVRVFSPHKASLVAYFPTAFVEVLLAWLSPCLVSQAYVTNLNAALEKQDAAESKGDVQGLIALQGAIKFNGGGHVNHSIFWQNLAPVSAGGGAPPEGDLAKYIEKAYGSFDVRC
jgi:superoxide dismutase